MQDFGTGWSLGLAVRWCFSFSRDFVRHSPPQKTQTHLYNTYNFMTLLLSHLFFILGRMVLSRGVLSCVSAFNSSSSSISPLVSCRKIITFLHRSASCSRVVDTPTVLQLRRFTVAPLLSLRTRIRSPGSNLKATATVLPCAQAQAHNSELEPK